MSPGHSWAIAGLFFASVGCAPAALDGPGARAGLVAALRRGDAVVLGGLLDEAPEALAPRLEDTRAELRARGDALEAAPLLESARLYLRSGRVIVLVREDGEWRIDRGVLGAPVLVTPLEALEAFARTLERVHAAHVAAVLTRRSRALLEDELDRWRAGLRDVDAIPIVIEGDLATATLPTGVVIELIRESGEWRIDDVH